VLLNVVWIGAIVASAGLAREAAARAMAWAIVGGGALQLGALAAVLRLRGVPVRPDFALSDPAVREVVGRVVPMVLGLAVVQINELVDSVIAEICVPGHGAVSYLYYGNQLVQLPLALVGTAVATAVFPSMASAAASGRSDELARLATRALQGTLYLSIPATVGLVVFARPIVELLFEHGAFRAEDMARSATVLSLYALGLWCYCANQVQVRAFYAQGDTRTPVRVSASMVLLNLALNLTLVWPLREAGIALATSISGVLSCLVLGVILRRRQLLETSPILRTLALSALASAAMGGAALGACHFVPDKFRRDRGRNPGPEGIARMAESQTIVRAFGQHVLS